MLKDTVYQSNRMLSQVKSVCRVLLCLAGVAAALGSRAFQSDATSDQLAEPAFGRIVSPTYLEKNSDPLSLNKESGWQISGLNTHFSSAIGKNMINFSGGLFYSREVAPQQLFTTNAFGPGAGLGMSSGLSQSGKTLGFSQSLFMNNPLFDGKSDQALFQRLDYQNSGLSLSGSYSSIGKDFQGATDLQGQVNPADAGLLGLGLTQSNFALNYTGIKGVKFASDRSSVENSLTGNAENGLTRTKQTNSLALALGQRQSVEYSINNLVEEWDPTVIARDTKQSQAQTLKWAGGLGKGSQFSLGQALVNTFTGQQETENTRQRDLSLQWGEWKNLSLTGGYVNKLNNLTGETNNTLNLDMNAVLSPRLQLTGKIANNTITSTAAPLPTKNDLFDLRLTANLARNLQFVSDFKDTDTTAQGTVHTRDQLMTWTPSKNWTAVSHLVTNANEKIDDTAVMEQTITGLIGTAKSAEKVNIFSRRDILSTTAQQDRYEVTYSRAIGGGAAPATLLMQAGSYQRASGDEQQRDDLMAVQLLSLHPGTRTTVSLGYYDGPLLGAGYLTYRTWGQRNAGNLGVWGTQDFTPYQEVGGEVIHRLTGSTQLTLRQMQGDLQGIGRQEMVEYGLEQQFGKAIFHGSNVHVVTPVKDSDSLVHDVMFFKLNVPGAKPLPEWAANSMRFTVFQDAATWGFGALPVWIPATQPVSGLTFEKRECPDTVGKLANQYTLQYAGMLTDNLCLQLSHEDNPLKAGTTQADALRRRYVHLGYQVKPKLQVFGRFVDEARKDQTLGQQTQTFGVIGQLSDIERLQIQFDGITRSAAGSSLNGNAYQLEYERTVSKDNTLSLKLRLNPEEFSSDQDRVRAEACYRRVF